MGQIPPALKLMVDLHDSSINSSSLKSSPLILRKYYSTGNHTDINVPSSSPQHSASILKKSELKGLKAEADHIPLRMVDPNSMKPPVSNHVAVSLIWALLAEMNKAISMTKSLLPPTKSSSGILCIPRDSF